jgi:tetratricopeptide (TPR) repeat protein
VTGGRAGRSFRAAVLVVLAVSLLAGAVRLEAVREHAYPASAEDEDAVYVQSGTAIRRMSGAFSALAADVYWIRTVQYYGGLKRAKTQETLAPAPPVLLTPVPYQQLFPLLDITTTLDPRFTVAYRFGAVFLAEEPPGGPGRWDLAIKLLEKGLAVQPDKWEYMEDAGFVYYWYRHDYREAAAWFDRAAAVPGAPVWLRALAATTLARGGDRRSSRTMWEAIRQSSDIDWLRANAEFRLAQLRALDDIDALQKIVDAFGQRGPRVLSWQALIAARVLGRIPLDPRGTPYEVSGGHVQLSRSSPLWPLPAEPS